MSNGRQYCCELFPGEFHPSIIRLHNATANAYKEQSKNVKAEYHKKIAEKLLDALLSTGDGKSIESAYCVQGISEEYRIMRHFGYKVTTGSDHWMHQTLR
jgi:hypothetical protein